MYQPKYEGKAIDLELKHREPDPDLRNQLVAIGIAVCMLFVTSITLP